MMRAECFRVKDSTPIWRLIEGFIRIFKKSLKIGRWPKINNFLEGEAAQCVKVVNGVNMFESKIKRAVWHWHWMILMWSFFLGMKLLEMLERVDVFFLPHFPTCISYSTRPVEAMCLVVPSCPGWCIAELLYLGWSMSSKDSKRVRDDLSISVHMIYRYTNILRSEMEPSITISEKPEQMFGCNFCALHRVFFVAPCPHCDLKCFPEPWKCG